MREMKNSGVEWIGEIPVDWHLTKIGSAYTERNIKVSDKEFMPLSVTKIGVVPQLETAAKTDNGDNRKLIKKNDFVINSRSDRRGSCGISEFDGSCSLINTVLKPRNNMCNSYYSYVFKSELFADEFYRWGNGIVDDLWSTKWTNMKRIYIPAPSLDEQHRIADYLDEKCAKIDAVIEKQKQVIEKLKEYKLSVITEAVTKGLDPTVPMKDSGVEWIGEIPEEWNLVKLKYAINKIGDIDHYMPESVDEGIPYLMTGDLKENVSSINFNACKKVSVENYQALCKKMSTQKGDIIFARYATIGTVAYVDVECDFLVSYSCVTIRVNKRKLNGKYLFFYLKSKTFFEEVKKYINANTQGNVGIDSLNKVRMPLPPIDTQKTVVDYIERKSNEIDLAIAKKQVIVEKLTEYKKSLIYEVVTGKREV